MSKWRVGEITIKSAGRNGHVMVCNVKKPKKKKSVVVKSSDRDQHSGEYKYGNFGSSKVDFLREGVMTSFHNAVKASEHEGSAAAAAKTATATVPAVASPSQPHHPELLPEQALLDAISKAKSKAKIRMIRHEARQNFRDKINDMTLARSARAKKYGAMAARRRAFLGGEVRLLSAQRRKQERLDALLSVNQNRARGLRNIACALKVDMNGKDQVHKLLRVACADDERFDGHVCSPHQLQKLQKQALSVRAVLKRLAERDQVELEGGEPVVLKVDDVVAAVAEMFSISPSTLWRWKTDFEEDWTAFTPDQRGRHDRDVIIDQEDMKLAFVEWMKHAASKRELSIRTASVFINTELLPSLGFFKLEALGVSLPVTNETVRCWMHRSGALCEVYKLGYYNDKHNDPSVIAYRTTYSLDMERLETRQPMYLHYTENEMVQLRSNRVVGDFEEEHPLGRIGPKGLLVGKDAKGENVYEFHVDAWSEFDNVRPDGQDGCGAFYSAKVMTPAKVVVPAFPPVHMMTPNASGVSSMVGRAVEKEFDDGKLYCGRVTAIWKPEGGEPIASVLFDDDKSDDILVSELAMYLVEMVPHTSSCGRFVQLPPQDWVCKEGHPYACCRCHLPLLHLGQDESVFKSNCLQRLHWVVDGQAGLRKKGEGTGLHVSGFTGDMGFGWPMKDWQLLKVNQYRAQKYGADVEPLTESPGFVYLKYGKNRDGYWDWDKLEVQLINIIDCFDALHPDRQLVAEFDWSQGHAKFPPDALKVSRLNANFGGKAAHMHSSVLTAGDVGDGEFEVWVRADGKPCRTPADLEAPGSHAKDLRVYEGQLQHLTFQPGDLPPYYALDTPEQDTEVQVRVTPAMRRKHASDFDKSGAAGTCPTLGTTTAKVVLGYMGKPKGKKQIVMERGLYPPGQDKVHDRNNDNEERSLWHILGACTDFQTEASAMTKLFTAAGHIAVFSPKGHPELAGRGIEYCWGTSKVKFRLVNNCDAKRLAGYTEYSLGAVTVKLARQHGRKSREYRRAYANPEDPQSKAAVEKLVKESKAHRNTFDQEVKYLRESLAAAEAEAEVV